MGVTRGRVALLVLAMLAAACGSRLSEAELEAARAGGDQGRGTELAAGPVEEGTTESTTAVTSAASGGSGGGRQQSSSGDGGQSGGEGGAARCRGTTASDVGVTPTEVKIGNLSTIGGPVPGFGQTGRNGLRAYVAYVNSQGGVCGRKLTIVPGDDRLQTDVNRSETERMSKQVFAFVSNTSVADAGGATVLEGTDIPNVSLATTQEASRYANNFSPNPIDPTVESNGAGKMVAYFKQKYGVSRGGVIWHAQPVSSTAAERYVNDMESQGIDVVYRQEVGVTETNYSGPAAEIESQKVDLLITVLEFNAIARLAKAMETNGYFPEVPMYGAQTYGRKFLEIAGSAAEGTKLGIVYEPLESRAAVPEVDLFVAWYERVNPGADIDFFAIEGWIAAKMFVEALTKAGAEPTRASVLEQLRTFTDYTAGGFVGHINPAQKRFAPCFLVVEVKGGKWVKTHPSAGAGFAC